MLIKLHEDITCKYLEVIKEWALKHILNLFKAREVLGEVERKYPFFQKEKHSWQIGTRPM